MAAAWCPSLVMLLLACCVAAAATAADDKLTHLHFYFHEVLGGAPNATAAIVAGQHKNTTTFGDMTVFDNALREGPDRASRLIGRAKGIGAQASLDASSKVTVIVFVFDDDCWYGDGTVATLGHYDLSGGPSERSIVGGTGKFRFARGYMATRVLSNTDNYLVVVIDMYLTVPTGLIVRSI